MPEAEVEGADEDRDSEVKLGDKIEILEELGNTLDEQELEPNAVAQVAGVDCGFNGVTRVLFIVDVKSEHGDELFDVKETGSPVDARVDNKHLIKRFKMAELLCPETIDIVDAGADTGTNVEAGAWGDVGFDICICAGNSSGAGSGIVILGDEFVLSGIPFDEELESNDGVQLKAVVTGLEGVKISTPLYNAGLNIGHGCDKGFILEADECLVPKIFVNNWKKKFNKSE